MLENLYIAKRLSVKFSCEQPPIETKLPDYGRHSRSQSKGGDLRTEAPAEEHAAKNLEVTVRHLGSTEKIYSFLGTLLCCQYKRRAPIVVCELLP